MREDEKENDGKIARSFAFFFFVCLSFIRIYMLACVYAAINVTKQGRHTGKRKHFPTEKVCIYDLKLLRFFFFYSVLYRIFFLYIFHPKLNFMERLNILAWQ